MDGIFIDGLLLGAAGFVVVVLIRGRATAARTIASVQLDQRPALVLTRQSLRAHCSSLLVVLALLLFAEMYTSHA